MRDFKIVGCIETMVLIDSEDEDDLHSSRIETGPVASTPH
jgi:hypothetical protein